MYLKPNDRMRTVIDKPYSTKGDHAKAYANLELWGRQGKFDGMDTQQMLAVYEREDAMFTSQDSVLPARPDEDSMRWYLNTVRRNFMARALKPHGVLPARYR